jgi:methyl-accepting chemotaxis protein
MSQQSTDEIKQIVNEITIKSQQVEQTMDESVGIIEEQNVSIKDAKELFNTISDSVNGLSRSMKTGKRSIIPSISNMES